MSKNWAYPPTTSGLHGRLADEIWVHFEILNSLQVKVFGFLLHLMSVQCYYNVNDTFLPGFPILRVRVK